MANPIQFDSFKPARRPECQRCEDMLADAVDDLLSDADQAFFNRHIASCVECMNALADAKRGAAWLEMLKTPRPEPSSQLLERILLQTSGRPGTLSEPELAGLSGMGVLEPFPTYAPMVQPGLPANVLPFRPHAPQVSRLSRWTHLMLEPRLAMTAAMAFFSIALTLNVTGVRLNQMHASDLKPGNLRRSYYQATASAARHYEGIRVVHVLESRVDDLRQSGPGNDDGLGGAGLRPESRRDLPREAPKPTPEKKLEVKPDGRGVSEQQAPVVTPHFVPVADKVQRVPVTPEGTIAQLATQEGGLA